MSWRTNDIVGAARQGKSKRMIVERFWRLRTTVNRKWYCPSWWGQNWGLTSRAKVTRKNTRIWPTNYRWCCRCPNCFCVWMKRQHGLKCERDTAQEPVLIEGEQCYHPQFPLNQKDWEPGKEERCLQRRIDIHDKGGQGQHFKRRENCRYEMMLHKSEFTFKYYLSFRADIVHIVVSCCDYNSALHAISIFLYRSRTAPYSATFDATRTLYPTSGWRARVGLTSNFGMDTSSFFCVTFFSIK